MHMEHLSGERRGVGRLFSSTLRRATSLATALLLLVLLLSVAGNRTRIVRGRVGPFGFGPDPQRGGGCGFETQLDYDYKHAHRYAEQERRGGGGIQFPSRDP